MQITTLPWTLNPIVVAGADATGEALALDKRETMFALHAIWPTGLEGNIGVEVSIDGAYWEPVPDSEQAVSAGSAGSYMWAYKEAPFNYARNYFDWVSGSGSIVNKASAKGAA